MGENRPNLIEIKKGLKNHQFIPSNEPHSPCQKNRINSPNCCNDSHTQWNENSLRNKQKTQKLFRFVAGPRRKKPDMHDSNDYQSLELPWPLSFPTYHISYPHQPSLLQTKSHVSNSPETVAIVTMTNGYVCVCVPGEIEFLCWQPRRTDAIHLTRVVHVWRNRSLPSTTQDDQNPLFVCVCVCEARGIPTSTDFINLNRIRKAILQNASIYPSPQTKIKLGDDSSNSSTVPPDHEVSIPAPGDEPELDKKKCLQHTQCPPLLQTISDLTVQEGPKS